MKKDSIFIIIAIILIIVCIFASTISKKDSNVQYDEDLLGIEYEIEGNEVSLDAYETENPVVAMYIEKYGSVVIELYPEIAPNTVNNFISLVKSGFYDNNSFHRLVPDFVLQGGDPSGNGTGGPDYSIEGEFTSNNFENNLSHTKGIVSMARSEDYNSAGSQFFIVLDDSTALDGAYASFGKVIDGWSNIEKIIKNEKIADQSSGKLRENLVLKKALVDLKGKEYDEVKKVSE